MGFIIYKDNIYGGGSGGSGGASINHVEITQAEYDALSEEEKNADIVYFITDGITTNGDTYTFTSNYLDFDIYKRGDIACVRKFGAVKSGISTGQTTLGKITDEKFIPSTAQSVLVTWRDTTTDTSTLHSFVLSIATDGTVRFTNVDSAISGTVIFNAEYFISSSTDENLTYTFTSDYIDFNMIKRDNIVFMRKFGNVKKAISTGQTTIGTITNEAFIPKVNQNILIVWRDGNTATSSMHSFIMSISTSGQVRFTTVDYGISTSVSVVFSAEYFV